MSLNSLPRRGLRVYKQTHLVEFVCYRLIFYDIKLSDAERHHLACSTSSILRSGNL